MPVSEENMKWLETKGASFPKILRDGCGFLFAFLQQMIQQKDPGKTAETGRFSIMGIKKER